MKYCLKNRKIQYTLIDTSSYNEIKQNYYNKDWYSKYTYLINAKRIIFPRGMNNIYYNNVPSSYEIENAVQTTKKEIYKYINTIQSYIMEFKAKCREDKITFESLVYRILKNPIEMMENILRFLPVNKRQNLDYINREYKYIYYLHKYDENKNILIFNFIYYLHDLFIKQKIEFEKMDKKIILPLSDQKFQMRHEELLSNYFSIPSKNEHKKPIILERYFNNL